MTKIIVDEKKARGLSKIPVPGPNMASNHIKLSRLQQIQADYQRKLLDEKEQKMIRLFEESQIKTLERIQQGNGKGSVRDFFQERRMMGNTHNAPQINQHFNQYNSRYSRYPSSQSSSASSKHSTASSKNSAGRDRANPLAPIQRKPVVNGESKTAIFHQKAKLARHRKTSSGKTPSSEKEVASIPGPKSATDISMRNGGLDHPEVFDDDAGSSSNLGMIKKVREKRLSGSSNRAEKDSLDSHQHSKMTSFQHWQEEQDEARRKRLMQHQQKIDNMEHKYDPVVASHHAQRNPSPKRSEPLFDEEEDESPPPNLSNIKKIREKRLSGHPSEVDNNEAVHKQDVLHNSPIAKTHSQVKPVDVQLKTLKIKNPSPKKQPEKPAWDEDITFKHESDGDLEDDDEEASDLDRQQRELMAMIEKQQRELDQMKRNRQLSSDVDEDPPTADADKRQPNHIASEEDDESTLRDDDDRSGPLFPSAPAVPHNKSQAYTRPAQRRVPPPVIHPVRDDGSVDELYTQALRDPKALPSDDNLTLLPCKNCGRRFTVDRISKHEKACKNATKKRKAFDPVKMRTQGTDMQKYVNKPKERTKPRAKSSSWRTKHENFIKAIRYAKQVTQMEKEGGKLSDLPPPPVSENPDYVQCQYCSRKFDPSVAERHIPYCKDTKARPAPPRSRKR